MTASALEDVDFRVFEGNFHCCTNQHSYTRKCDRELLVAPVLCAYAKFLRDGHGASQRVNPLVMELVFSMTPSVFPLSFDFEKRLDDDLLVVEQRELFGPLPEIVQERIKSQVPQDAREVPSSGRSCEQQFLSKGDSNDSHDEEEGRGRQGLGQGQGTGTGTGEGNGTGGGDPSIQGVMCGSAPHVAASCEVDADVLYCCCDLVARFERAVVPL